MEATLLKKTRALKRVLMKSDPLTPAQFVARKAMKMIFTALT